MSKERSTEFSTSEAKGVEFDATELVFINGSPSDLQVFKTDLEKVGVPFTVDPDPFGTSGKLFVLDGEYDKGKATIKDTARRLGLPYRTLR